MSLEEVVIVVVIPCAEILDIPVNPIAALIPASIPIGGYIILLCKLLFHGDNSVLIKNLSMTTYLFLVIETKDIVCEKYYFAIDRICIYCLFIYIITATDQF